MSRPGLQVVSTSMLSVGAPHYALFGCRSAERAANGRSEDFDNASPQCSSNTQRDKHAVGVCLPKSTEVVSELQSCKFAACAEPQMQQEEGANLPWVIIAARREADATVRYQNERLVEPSVRDWHCDWEPFSRPRNTPRQTDLAVITFRLTSQSPTKMPARTQQAAAPSSRALPCCLQRYAPRSNPTRRWNKREDRRMSTRSVRSKNLHSVTSPRRAWPDTIK